MNLYDQIPGLREAVEQERFDRSVAFLGLPESVCGVACRPLTLFDVLRLDVVGSPFISGGTAGSWDVFVFLKLQRTSSIMNWPRMLFYDAADGIESISKFVDEAFADGPPTSGGEDVKYWTIANDFIEVFGRCYGWDYERVLNIPLKVLFPQYKLVAHMANPMMPLFNPRSDLVRGEWLRKN